MWKTYIKFNHKILKIEKAQFFVSKNLYKIPKIRRTFLTCNIKETLGLGIKKILIKLCYLQIILNSKSYISLKKNQQKQISLRKMLNSRRSLLFIQHLITNIFPQLDSIRLSKSGKKRSNFNYSFDPKQTFKRILKIANLLEKTQNIYIYVYIYCQNKNTKNILLWRWLKFPTLFT